MITAIHVLHVTVSILLIIAVLLQGGENVDITAAFGGVSQAAFGPRGSVTLLAKVTWGLAVIFVATSVALAVYASKPGSRSVMETAPSRTVPAAPAAPTPSSQAPANSSPFTTPPLTSSPATSKPTTSKPPAPSQSAPATPAQSAPAQQAPAKK